MNSYFEMNPMQGYGIVAVKAKVSSQMCNDVTKEIANAIENPSKENTLKVCSILAKMCNITPADIDIVIAANKNEDEFVKYFTEAKSEVNTDTCNEEN